MVSGAGPGGVGIGVVSGAGRKELFFDKTWALSVVFYKT